MTDHSTNDDPASEVEDSSIEEEEASADRGDSSTEDTDASAETDETSTEEGDEAADNGESSLDVTDLLRQWSKGDPDALNKVLPMIFDEIRQLARKALSSESPAHTLQPTDLVHEAYLRLIGRETYGWNNRAEFFGALARLMRQILVDHARARNAQKRGGGVPKLPLDERIAASRAKPDELIAIDEALTGLQKENRRQYDVIMLWYFVGLTQQEIARELGISVNTVRRDLQRAQDWLFDELQDAEEFDEEEEKGEESEEENDETDETD